MDSIASVKRKIRSAFRRVSYPGDDLLTESCQGSEPRLLIREFRGKTKWSALAPEFIDQAPAGFGSALGFFSDIAFRFYIPAYLIADLDKQLAQADPVFYLTCDLVGQRRNEIIHKKRYGSRTWVDIALYRFSVFSVAECAAIVAYLQAVHASRGGSSILEAIDCYWGARVRAGLDRP